MWIQFSKVKILFFVQFILQVFSRKLIRYFKQILT